MAQDSMVLGGDLPEGDDGTTGEPVIFDNPDLRDPAASPGQQHPATSTRYPDAVPPFESQPGGLDPEADAQDHSRRPGEGHGSPSQEPWAEDPANFDFMSLPAAERAAAFVRFAQQYPEIALQRQMAMRGFHNIINEKTAQIQRLEEQLRSLTGGAAPSATSPAARAREMAAQAAAGDEDVYDALVADYVAWEAEYRRNHPDKSPDVAEVMAYMAAQAAKRLYGDVRPTLDALRQSAENQLIADIKRQMTELEKRYPQARDVTVQEQIVNVLQAVIGARPVPYVNDDDVERAFLYVAGPDLVAAQARATAGAREQQAAMRAAAPAVPPADAGPTAPAGPKPDPRTGTYTIEAIAAHQKQRGLRALLQDYLASRRA